MNLTILKNRSEFPLHILKKLANSPVDYLEKHASIKAANAGGEKHLEAGVVVLLHFKSSEFVFQLIKRSETVAQAGDISCPGGILEESTDELLHHIIFEADLIKTIDARPLALMPNRDERTAALIRLFLMNGLREAWEEIGLSPLNVSFLGALPTYSLTYFARTIFPIVCLVRHQYEFKINSEVDNVLEIPVSAFFNPSSYALLEIAPIPESSAPRYDVKFPCMVIENKEGTNDILWGATFNIITRFLNIIAEDSMPAIEPTRVVTKTLSANYTSGNRR